MLTASRVEERVCQPQERVVWERRRAGHAKVTGLNTDQSLRAPRKEGTDGDGDV